MTAVLIVALVLPWLLLAVETWLLYVLFRQHGRTLLRQEALSERLAALEEAAAPPQPAAPPGLAPGALAPAFALPDLEGEERTLDDYRGRPLLLVFFDPQCSFCAQMAPELGALNDEETRVLLVSRGDPDENRRMAEEYGWQCDVVIEETWEVAISYGATGTPTGYLVDAEGKVASELAVGSSELLSLLHESPSNGVWADDQDGSRRGRGAGVRVRDIGTSRLNREGLAAGERAPDFSLPDLEGRRHSLTDFRGKRVLLVFSDPECGPCDALVPDLVSVHQRHRNDDLAVVLISRGDLQANRAKAREHGMTFPVLLQKGWRTSKDYCMFATPIGYLIDQDGVIAKDVAVGADAIRALV